MPLSQLVFPHPFTAGEEGLLAYSRELTDDLILLAYRFGIFPWNNSGEPILWWFPDPRMVLFPEEIHISKSMRPYFNQEKYRITIDKEFEQVIHYCKKIRVDKGEGTWIHKDLKEAFLRLHENGYAHSIEVWDRKDELVGGLYGLAIGKIFFGESMFHLKRDASKFALIRLAQLLQPKGFRMIDCQIYTEHLESMGARQIDGQEFMKHLKANIFDPDLYFLEGPGQDPAAFK